MAVGTHVYGSAVAHLGDADIDWVADTIKIMLVTSSYTPDLDAHDFRNDVTNEVSGTGYTAGGATLSGKAVTVVGGSNETQFDADNVTWTGLDLSSAARYAVLYKARGGASSADELIGYVDLDSDRDPNGGNLTITWPSDGVFKGTYS
jgi:hypothetical protein